MVSFLLRGELPEKRKAELLAHIEKCPACSEYYRRLRKVDDLLETIALPEAGEGPLERVRADARRKKRARTLRYAVLAAAAAVVLAVTAMLVFSGGPDKNDTVVKPETPGHKDVDTKHGKQERPAVVEKDDTPRKRAPEKLSPNNDRTPQKTPEPEVKEKRVVEKTSEPPKKSEKPEKRIVKKDDTPEAPVEKDAQTPSKVAKKDDKTSPSLPEKTPERKQTAGKPDDKKPEPTPERPGKKDAPRPLERELLACWIEKTLGPVYAARKNAKKAVMVKDDTELEWGSKLITGRGGRALIEGDEALVFAMNERAELELTRDANKAYVVTLVKGEAIFFNEGEEKTLVVKTPVGEFSCPDGLFNLKVTSNTTVVCTVIEGKVSASAPKRKKIDQPANTIVAYGTKKAKQLKWVPLNKHLAWSAKIAPEEFVEEYLDGMGMGLDDGWDEEEEDDDEEEEDEDEDDDDE